jgi:hypothetical protein
MGIVCLVHGNTRVPFIETNGIYLKPGGKHKLGYKQKITSFLSAPFTKCTSTIPSSMKPLFSNFGDADYDYSSAVCFLQCRQTFM